MKKITTTVSLSLLCALLSACGGGSNVINEDPTKKPTETTATGCTVSSSESCFPFVLEYPVAGMQYTCSSDKVNIFKTQLSGNIVTGGCDKADTATFFLNAGGNARIELGSAKMSDLGVVSTDKQPVHLTLLQLAKGLTGKAASSLTMSDATVQMAIKLVKIFQAVHSQKLNNVVGDIQPITLDSSSLTGLSSITSSVGAAQYQNGQDAALLKPWIDLSAINDDTAFKVLKKAINISQGAVYQADLPVFASVSQGMTGVSNASPQQTFIGIFYVMNDRQGYSHGYGVQWRGIPPTGTQTNTSAVTLVTTTNPIMMRADTQNQLFNPLTQYIDGFKFMTQPNTSSTSTTTPETLTINQGRLLNDYMSAGTDSMYQQITKTTTAAPSGELTKWTMPTATDSFSGSADIAKAYAMSYLDNRVFKSSNNVAAGSSYYFPLYATLNFKFSPVNGQAAPDVKLGIVIDENGDIRTDIRNGAEKSQDMSGQCGTVPDSTAASFVDNYGAKQYRIGTISAANYQPNQQDVAISPWMILSGSQFGDLDGALLGFSGLIVGNATSSSSGAKINLYSLYNSSKGNINLTDYNNGVANWSNIYNSYKAIFVQSQSKDSTNGYVLNATEANQILRTNGTVTISLASCYAGAKTK